MPVCLHLDHAAAKEEVYKALRWGYTGIMQDGSSLSFEENSKLKTIGNYAFYGYKNLTSLTIPEGVTSIGENALAYTGIPSVHIPSTASVGSGAFSNSSLTTVTFAEGSKITEIPSRAFQNTHITSINNWLCCEQEI